MSVHSPLNELDDRQLGALLVAGRQLRSRTVQPLWETDEDAHTLKLADRARDVLILRNGAVCMKVAKAWAKKPGCTVADLRGEAFVALCRSIDTWNPERGFLWPYLMREVNKYVGRRVQLYAYGAVVLPEVTSRNLGKARQLQNEAVARGETLSLVEAERALGAPPGSIVQSVVVTQEYRPLHQLARSNDDKGSHETLELADQAAQEAFDDVDQEDATARLLQQVRSRLTPLENEYLRLRWGLDGGGYRQTNTVARLLGVTNGEALRLEASVYALARGETRPGEVETTGQSLVSV